MTNHPNRASRASPMAATVKAAREALGLTPDQAGAMIHERGRRWTDFESGQARMHAAAWELFQIKTKGRPGSNGSQALRAFAERPVILDHVGNVPAPRLGETWYDRDTGCAVAVVEVAAGIVYARGRSHFVQAPVTTWVEDFQRDPIAV